MSDSPGAVDLVDLVMARRLDRIEARAFSDYFAAAPADLARKLGLRVVHVGGACVLLAPALPMTLLNRAIGLGVERPATERDVDDVLRAFAEARVMVRWIHVNPAAEPVELASWMAQRGMIRASRPAWAKLVRGTESAPAFSSSLVVREAAIDDARVLSRVLCEAHEMPAFLAPWIAALVGRPGWRGYLVLEGDTPVGGGFLHLQGSDAWLGIAGTIPSHRCLGGQRAVLARRVADAIAAGCTVLAAESAEPVGDETNSSLANMRRSGFRQVCTRWNLG